MKTKSSHEDSDIQYDLIYFNQNSPEPWTANAAAIRRERFK